MKAVPSFKFIICANDKHHLLGVGKEIKQGNISQCISLANGD